MALKDWKKTGKYEWEKGSKFIYIQQNETITSKEDSNSPYDEKWYTAIVICKPINHMYPWYVEKNFSSKIKGEHMKKALKFVKEYMKADNSEVFVKCDDCGYNYKKSDMKTFREKTLCKKCWGVAYYG